MDDLDRLHDRLVASIRDGFPHLLDRAFQLGDIPEHLVPYRLNRRELGFESVRQYELALMRLAAGERGYLRLESAVQDAFRRSLVAPEPDAALLRDHARASVAVAHGDARADATRASAAPAPDAASEGAPAAAAETANGSIAASPPSREPPDPRPAFAPPQPPHHPAAHEPSPGPTEIGGPCRYCGQSLPEGRPVTYCPSCGQNVTVRHCPACSTELEIGWRFCITCGRAMDESALGADLP